MLGGVLQRIRAAFGSRPTSAAFDLYRSPVDDAEPPVRVYYYLRDRNIGDLITAPLVGQVLRRNTLWTEDPSRPHLLAIGSILDRATRQSVVWGTGAMHPDVGVGDPEPANVLAVRGKLTYEACTRAGLRLNDIPLGDPGMLIRRLLPASRPAIKHDLGIVPHYVDRSGPFVEHLRRQDGVAILDVQGPPETFMQTMMSCKAIASTSLHGLIFAEALGIPNLWMELSDGVHGKGFKFRDWFSLAGNPQQAPFRPAGSETAREVAAMCEPRRVAIDEDALANALRAPHVEACSAAPHRAFVPTRASRKRGPPVFLVTRNQGERLRHVVAAYRRRPDPLDVVVRDCGSDEPGTIAVLRKLEAEGIRVYRGRSYESVDQQASAVDEAVTEFFAGFGEPTRYVVSDGSMDLQPSLLGLLPLYGELLDRFSLAACVGPLRQPAPAGLETTATSFGNVAYVQGRVGPAFALHRAGERFHAEKQGLSVQLQRAAGPTPRG
jgi:hypothetical protein